MNSAEAEGETTGKFTEMPDFYASFPFFSRYEDKLNFHHTIRKRLD